MSDFYGQQNPECGNANAARQFLPPSVAPPPQPGAMLGVLGAGYGMLDRVAPDFGAPFLRVTYEGVSWPAAAWALSDGTVVLKIGCEARLLDDWETRAEKHASRNGMADVFRSFCSLVRVALDALRRPVTTPTAYEPDMWNEGLVSALLENLDERPDLRERVRAHLATETAPVSP